MKKMLFVIVLYEISIAAWIVNGELFQLVAVFAFRVLITSVCATFLFMLTLYRDDDDSMTKNNYGPELNDKYIGGDGLF